MSSGPCTARAFEHVPDLDAICKVDRKKYKQVMLLVHPDKNRGCRDLAESLSKRMTGTCDEEYVPESKRYRPPPPPPRRKSKSKSKSKSRKGIGQRIKSAWERKVSPKVKSIQRKRQDEQERLAKAAQLAQHIPKDYLPTLKKYPSYSAFYNAVKTLGPGSEEYAIHSQMVQSYLQDGRGKGIVPLLKFYEVYKPSVKSRMVTLQAKYSPKLKAMKSSAKRIVSNLKQKFPSPPKFSPKEKWAALKARISPAKQKTKTKSKSKRIVIPAWQPLPKKGPALRRSSI